MDNTREEIIRLWNEEKMSIPQIEKRLGVTIILNEGCDVAVDMCCGNFSYETMLLG